LYLVVIISESETEISFVITRTLHEAEAWTRTTCLWLNTHTTWDEVCGWTVHTDEFIELHSVHDTMGKFGRDYESIAVSFSSPHKYRWWAGFMCLMHNIWGRM